jgi:hypothetical protein
MIVAGAVLVALALLVPPTYAAYFAAVAAIVLLGSTVAAFVGQQRSDDRQWFDARAVEEAVKTLTWRYMMRVEPFRNDDTSDRKFLSVLDDIREARSGVRSSVPAHDGSVKLITSRMREVRQRPLEERRDLYVNERLDEQATWYASKSEANRSLAAKLFWASLATQFMALTLAVWRVASPIASLSLIGPLLALGIAFRVWTQLGRYDELSRSYALTNQELVSIKARASTVDSEHALASLVYDGEGAISREHTMWIARRGSPLPQQVS